MTDSKVYNEEQLWKVIMDIVRKIRTFPRILRHILEWSMCPLFITPLDRWLELYFILFNLFSRPPFHKTKHNPSFF